MEIAHAEIPTSNNLLRIILISLHCLLLQLHIPKWRIVLPAKGLVSNEHSDDAVDGKVLS
jgi:hypothetical protein